METSLPMYVFTSQIATLVFSGAGTEPETVTLSNGGDVVLTTKLYPVDGKFYIYDAGKLYEEYLRQRGNGAINPYLLFQVDIGDFRWEDNMVIYCPFNCSVSAVDFITSHFLTTLRAKRVPSDCADGDEYIDVLLTGEEASETQSVEVEASFRNSDGETETHVCSFTISSGELYARFKTDPGQLSNLFSQYSDEEMEGTWSELTPLCYSFRIGGRKLTYFVDPDFKPTARFRFRNAFNVDETIYLEGETVTKTDTERSMATSHGVSMFYDQVDSQEFEVTTAPLSSEEAAWATQLLLSHKVLRMEAYGETEEVLITDMSAEVTDDDSEYRRLKFTYRLAKQGASLDFRNQVISNSRFTETYSLHFA